jgi:GTP-binding protein
MQIKSATFELSAPDLASCPPPTVPEFAFIGRSNVGKSSLLNMLTGKKDLAKVSATPGHTKTINFFAINQEWRLVDLPGYGYAEVARKDKARFNRAVEEYLANRPSLAGVFVLIDSKLPPQKIDLEFVEWLGSISAPIVLVFTKVDRITPTKLKTNMEAFQQKIAEHFEEQPATFTCSSMNRLGRQELLGAIEAVLNEG